MKVELNKTVTERSLRDLMHVLFRHKRMVLLTLLTGVALAVLVNAVTTPTYRSSARLMVRIGRESVTLDPTASTGQVVSMGQTREREINSEIEILRSRELAQGVIEAMPELLVGARARDAVLIALQENVQIEALKGTNILSLSFDSTSPKLAQAVLSRLIDLYLDKHIAVHRTTGAYNFFIQETARLTAQLSEKEGLLRDLKNRSRIGSVDEQRRLLLGRGGSLQSELQESEAALSASRAKLGSMQKSLESLPETLVTQETTGLPDTAVDGMRQKVYELQLKEQELLSKFNEGSPPVLDIRRQIEEARDLLARESQKRTQVTTGLSLPHQQVKGDLLAERAYQSSLVAKMAALRKQQEGSRKELTALNGAEVNLAQLERDVETLRSTYRKYSENLEQARIDQALESEKISNIGVVQQATLEPRPVTPRSRLNLALGLLLGVVAGLSFAFGAELFDHTFRRPQDIEEQLEIPILVAIPELPDAPDWPATKVLRPGTPAPALPEGQGKPGVLAQAIAARTSEFRHYADNLWDHVVVSTNGDFRTPCLLAVTSCHAGAGTTTVAASLAASIRMAGQKNVLLVDGHILKRSAETNDFMLPPEAVRIMTEDLFSGDTGPDVPAPVDLRSLLKREGAFVVVDTPPLLDSAAALRICARANGVVLVVEAEKTRWEAAHEAREMLRRSGAHLVGAVLNRRRFHVPEWLYRRF